jgi:hypothetical protein
MNTEMRNDMDDTQALILSEIKDLRTDLNTFARDMGERVTKVETKLYPLIDNGQPGRITHIERAVERIQRWRWQIVGMAAGVSGAVSVLAWVIVEARR